MPEDSRPKHFVGNLLSRLSRSRSNSRSRQRKGEPSPASTETASQTAVTDATRLGDKVVRHEQQQLQASSESARSVVAVASAGSQTENPTSHGDNSTNLWKSAEQALKAKHPKLYDVIQELKGKSGSAVIFAQRMQSLSTDMRHDAQAKVDSQTRGIHQAAIRVGLVIQTLRAPVMAVARFDPTGASSVAIPAATSLLDLVLAKEILDRTVYTDLHDICSKIKQWHDKEELVLKRRRLHEQTAFADFEKSLTALYTLILEYEARLARFAEGNPVAALLRTAYMKSELPMLKKDIDAHHKACETDFETIKLGRDLRDADVEILQFISDDDTTSVHRTLLNRSRIKDRYASAGDWLLASKSYRDWLIDDKQEVFWLCGSAGTGKTTLCCKVVEDFLESPGQTDGKLFAYVYCSGTDAKAATNSGTVMSSLVRQLSEVRGHGILLDPSIELHSKYNDHGAKVVLLEQEKDDLLSRLLAQGRDAYIVVDALDECVDRNTLLKRLKDAAKSINYSGKKSKLKLFLTSRHGVDVKQYFPAGIEQVLIQKLTLPDMKRYLHVSIFEHEERSWVRTYPDQAQELYEVLLEQAGGIFKWVELRLSLIFGDDIFPGPSYDDPRDIEDVIKNLRDRVVAQDDKMHDVWAQLLERNVDPKASRHARRNAFRALRLVLGAFYPLTFRQIAEAIQIEDPEMSNYHHQNVQSHITEDYIRRVTNNFLIEISQDDNEPDDGDDANKLIEEGNDKGKPEKTVRFAHMSAVDFLRRGHSGGDLDTFTSLHCHTELMHTCLYFVRSLPGCVSRKTKDISVFLAAPMYTRDSLWPGPFLKYAYWNWPAHCGAVLRLCKEKDDMVLDLAQNVLANEQWQQTFEVWHEVCFYCDAFRPHNYRGKYWIGDWLRLARATQPGLFIASIFDLPKLAGSLVRQLGPRARSAWKLFNSVGDCIISTVFSQRSNRVLDFGIQEHVSEALLLETEGTDTLPAIFEKLLEIGADVDLLDRYGCTPMIRITESYRISTRNWSDLRRAYQMLVAKDAALNIYDERGWSIVHYAAFTSNAEALNWLYEHGADLNGDNELQREPPLAVAVEHRSAEAFIALLKNGAKFEAAFPDRSMWNVVVSCFDYGQELAAFAYDHNPGVDSRDGEGRTPLMLAVSSWDLEWMQYLLLVTPAHTLQESNKRELAFAALLRRWSEVEEACDVFLLLRCQGVSFDLKDGRGTTLLMIAASRLDCIGVWLLLQFGHDAKSTDENGWTALHYTLVPPEWISHFRGPRKTQEIIAALLCNMLPDEATNPAHSIPDRVSYNALLQAWNTEVDRRRGSSESITEASAPDHDDIPEQLRSAREGDMNADGGKAVNCLDDLYEQQRQLRTKYEAFVNYDSWLMDDYFQEEMDRTTNTAWHSQLQEAEQRMIERKERIQKDMELHQQQYTPRH